MHAPRRRSQPRRPPLAADLSPAERAALDAERAAYEAHAAWARGRAAGPAEGLFGPGSVTWMLYREWAILGAGPAAVVLEVLHPGVAAGVAAHSVFLTDPLGRARRTFAASYTQVFGDLDTAMRSGKRLFALHSRARGALSADDSARRAGQPYRANDPASLAWVLATLAWTAARLFEQLVRPLSAEERDRYVQEARVSGASLGMDPEALPAPWSAFEDYFERMVAEELELGATARRLLAALFDSPWTRGRADEWLAIGLLPAAWRHALGLPWDARAQRRHAQVLAGLRALTRLPPPLRFCPAWHQADLRLALAAGRAPPAVPRLINALDARLDLPGSLRPVALPPGL